MENDEKILSGILVGLVVWLVTKGAMYLMYRGRLKAGIIADIELLTKSIKESNEYLTDWIGGLREGHKIDYSARHSPDGYEYFRSILTELPKYFSKNTFSRIFRFYKNIEEYDVLLGGFFADATAWKGSSRLLSGEDIRYLARKQDRLVALGNILTKTPITRLADIPADYEGKIAPKTVLKG